MSISLLVYISCKILQSGGGISNQLFEMVVQILNDFKASNKQEIHHLQN